MGCVCGLDYRGIDLREVAQYEQAVQQLDIENFTSFVIHSSCGPETPTGASATGMWPECVTGLMRGGGCLYGTPRQPLTWIRKPLPPRTFPFSQVVVDSGADGPLIPILASLLDQSAVSSLLHRAG